MLLTSGGIRKVGYENLRVVKPRNIAHRLNLVHECYDQCVACRSLTDLSVSEFGHLHLRACVWVPSSSLLTVSCQEITVVKTMGLIFIKTLKRLSIGH